MKVEKKSNKNLNYQKLIISLIAIVLVVILVIFTSKLFSKNNVLEYDEFERIAIYSYLENDLLDIYKIYQLSGKSDYNEFQVFQSKLKQALDSYFSTHTERTVSTSTILSMIEPDYVPASFDFHGIVVSDYEFNPKTDSFILSKGTNANIAGIEADINSIDYSDKKVVVQQIEKTSDDNYKVTFNIVNNVTDNESSEATGEAIVSLKDEKLVLDSCKLND